MRNLIFFFIFLSVFLVGGCTVEPPAKIPVEIPRGKTVVVVPQKGTANNKNQQVYADPTRGDIDNLSQEVAKIWLDRKTGKPDLVLQPGTVEQDIYFPLGRHKIYIERWCYTRYGLKYREGSVVRINVGKYMPKKGDNWGWQVVIKNNWISSPEGNFYFYKRNLGTGK